MVTGVEVTDKILILNLMIRDPCIINIFQYINNKMQRYTAYLYLETALHISGGTSTNHREHTQLYLWHLVFVKLTLLPVAIMEESQLFHDSGR